LSKYKGEEQHGYWWLHSSGTLRYSTNCHGVDPITFFNTWTCIKWWHVQCELDWYRMNKEYKVLVEGPIEPTYA